MSGVAEAPDLVIFDCDGVLVDSETITMRVFGEALRELGLDYSLNELFEQFVGLTTHASFLKAEQLLGKPLPDDFIPQQIHRTEQALKQSLQPIRGIPELLSQLTYPYCLASNSDHAKITTCLMTTALFGYFQGRIFSAVDDVEHAKPWPDIYLYAAEQMQSEPECCVVIEDSPIGVRAAVSAGMTVLGYSQHTPEGSLRQAGAHLIFNNMAELPSLLNSGA